MHGSSLRRPLLRQTASRTTALATSTATPAAYICRHCVIATSTHGNRRHIQISSAPATEYPKPSRADAFGSAVGFRDESDAKFEVLGSPYSLLSVSLSASQNLYTRRGTLVSVAGKVENATSTLSLLAPVRRALFGIPFLYQRITSTTPLTLLIATKAANTTLFTLRLDGTTDWVVSQRNALLAWTGHTLSVSPQHSSTGTSSLGLGIANWGSSFVTGRGLVALSAPGYIYPVTVAAGEELVVHPSHVVAYAVNKSAPQPFRFRSAGMGKGTVATAVEKVASAVSSTASSTAQITTKAVRNLSLQTPAASAVSTTSSKISEYVETVRESAAYKYAARALFEARTVLRRTIWGDRLFVHVRGPTTLLMSSRGVRVSDVLTRENVNEIADTEAGSVAAAVERATGGKPVSDKATSEAAIKVETVKPEGKVELTGTKDLKEFVR
ncbi:mitochondrial protein [Ophiostoma piceae UAMH 11346]|uniref:Altered inheritance of mitochondria protein 24, mitochondrial n=1 Tax=Ophiostoma piceae (strain UAMH 11346) TaxID=1262450 RepID=S3CBI8_OPHP1|nr:mitochondrial protein [Ophiostoma piceae UAMH 11346]